MGALPSLAVIILPCHHFAPDCFYEELLLMVLGETNQSAAALKQIGNICV